MLQVSQLHQYYGGSHILRGVDFSARQGEVTCLLGRNGVGKTTLLKCLMGLIPARSGEVRWQDQNITQRMRGDRPWTFTNLKQGDGLSTIIAFLEDKGMLGK